MHSHLTMYSRHSILAMLLVKLLFSAVFIRLSLASPGLQFRNTTEPDSISRVFTPAERYFFDVNGDAIDVSNGKLDFVNGQYLWYGGKASCPIPTGGKCGIWSWSSNDLETWYPNGALFDPSLPENIAACEGDFGGCGRPKIVYNEQTKKYVMYSFSSRLANPGTIPVFVSDQLATGYSFVGYSQVQGVPENYVIEDLGLSVIDGVGYVIWTMFNLVDTFGLGGLAGYSSIWPPFIQTLNVQQLTPDFLNGTGVNYPIVQGSYPVTQNSTNLIDGQVEAPDFFKRGDYYYALGSSTCNNCNQSIIIAYRSQEPSGPWERQIVKSEFTCGGQMDGVATIPSVSGGESTYLLSADAYSSSPLASSADTHGYNIFTLSFNSDGSIQPLSCDPQFQYTVEGPSGTINGSLGDYAQATDKAPNKGNYIAANDFPYANYYQTWVSTKSGVLKTIGINLASPPNPTFNMTIQVFRYPDETTLLSPYYIWETLTTVTVGLGKTLPQTSLLNYQVHLNATVQEGDHLGFTLNAGSLGGQSNAPFAYLINDKSEPGHKLYAEPRGHVSEEEDGSPPVKLLPNRELKWYAVVE